jgi:hypothetical protein
MVNRQDRVAAARLIRDFGDGLVTNHEYDDVAEEWDWKDIGLAAVYMALQGMYDDVGTQRLTGDRQLSQERWELVTRCTLFLETDLEYEWPDARFISFSPVSRFALIVVGLAVVLAIGAATGSSALLDLNP